MEYYIFTTYNCNMKCSFCFASKIRLDSTDPIKELSDERISSVINFIDRDIKLKGDKENSLVFSGGEPLLVPEVIMRLTNSTSHLGLKYLIYTNGLLLNKVPFEFLNSMDIVFVSIDGDKKAHEKHRGKRSYDYTISNIRKIKNKLKSHLVARITLEEDSNIYNSVINVLPLTDSVYWQIANKPLFNDFDSFLDNYHLGLRELFSYWFSNFERGVILGITPFQSVIVSLIFNEIRGERSFRCGALTEFLAIDIYGNIYACDEQVGNLNNVIGNVRNGNNINMQYKEHAEIFDDCKSCEASDTCLGRCWKCLVEYSPTQIRNYCLLTKCLIQVISDKIPEIRKIVHERKLKSIDIYPGPYCTEEIP